MWQLYKLGCSIWHQFFCKPQWYTITRARHATDLADKQIKLLSLCLKRVASESRFRLVSPWCKNGTWKTIHNTASAASLRNFIFLSVLTCRRHRSWNNQSSSRFRTCLEIRAPTLTWLTASAMSFGNSGSAYCDAATAPPCHDCCGPGNTTKSSLWKTKRKQIIFCKIQNELLTLILKNLVYNSGSQSEFNGFIFLS